MNKAFYIGLILCVPAILSAQQKGNSQQDLQKQIQALQQEMQSKISALQDSIALLQKELKSQSDKNQSYGFFYQKPDEGKEKAKELEDLLRDHSFNYGYQYRDSDPGYKPIEPVPFDYHLVLPPEARGYQYDWKQLEVPPCPEIPKHKHRHDWMKMLPFGDFLKN
jgi:hypothetical protein